jgi:hypothetical protein
MPRARRMRRIGAWIAWLLAVGGLTYWFVHASNTVALLCAGGLAGLLYVLRRYARLPYGLLECLAGSLLLAQAITLAPAVDRSALHSAPIFPSSIHALLPSNPTPACS